MTALRRFHSDTPILLALAAAIGVTAAVSPRLLALAAVGVIAVFLAIRHLPAALLALIVVAMFEELPGVGIIALSKPVGALLTLSWAVALLSGDNRPLLHRDNPLLAGAVGLVVFWAGLSVTWAWDVGTTISSTIRLAQVAILFFVTFSIVHTVATLRAAVWALMTGAFLTTMYGILTGKRVEGRFVGALTDANFYAALVVVSLFLVLFTYRHASHRARAVLLVFAAADVVGLAQAQSRGSLLALGVGLAVAIVVAGPDRSRILGVSMIAIALGVGYFTLYAPSSLKERFSNINVESSAGRADTWQIALRMASDNPAVGVGLGNYPIVQNQYLASDLDLTRAPSLLQYSLVTHNTYLELLAELGAVGLAAFALLAGASWLTGAITLLRAPPDSELASLTRALLSASAALLVAYIFLSGEYDKIMWVTLGLLASLRTVAATAGVTARKRRATA